MEFGPMIALQSLLDDRKCYETVRRLRWPEGEGDALAGAAGRRSGAERQP